MNRKQEILFISSTAIIIISLIISSIFEGLYNNSIYQPMILSIMIIVAITIIILAVFLVIKQHQNKFNVQKSFDYYIEKMISNVGVGIIIFNDQGIIIYSSKFIYDRLNHSLVGKNINEISDSFKKHLFNNKTNFIFEHEQMVYEVLMDIVKNIILFKDISEKSSIIKQYIDEKTVIGELEIDNFQEYQNTLPEEELFQIQSEIIKLLDYLVETYNVVYRQYVNGKYIIILDEQTLYALMEDKFNIFTKLSKSISILNIKLTVSAGFGADSSLTKDLMSLAKKAISQSQARGGDQVTVAFPNKDYKYFGATTQPSASTSRIKVSQVSKIFTSRLEDSKIKNVLIYGHAIADLDVLGSAYGIAEMALAFNKKPNIVLYSSDKTTKQAIKKFVDKKNLILFIKPYQVSKIIKSTSLVVLTDVSLPERTDYPESLKGYNKNNIFIFDHHRIATLPSEVLKTNVYIDSSASSASEIVSEIIQFSKKNIKISRVAAQLMLAGIYLDTKQFQQQTSSRTFAVASWLESFGAEASVSSELLKLPEEQTKLINQILTKLFEVKPGYYMAAYDSEADSDVVSVAADEILRTSGRKAAFVVAKVPGKKEFKLSARSIDKNVQVIAEKVGGGGNFSASAATSEENFDIFVDNIKQAIVSEKNESNNN